MSVLNRLNPTKMPPPEEMTNMNLTQALQAGLAAELDVVDGLEPDLGIDPSLPIDERHLAASKTIRDHCKHEIAFLEKQLAQFRRSLRMAEAAISAGQAPEKDTPVKEVKT